MTSSSAARFVLLVTIAAGGVFDGCATRRTLVPKLTFDSLVSDIQAPQAAGTTIRWRAAVTGGVGDLTYEFRYRRDDEQSVGHIGQSATWDWTPAEAGDYAVGVIVRDSLGYVRRSGWSSEYRIAPALVLTSLSADVASPQRARARNIFWTVAAAGGVADRTYEFRLDDGQRETLEQTGSPEYWMWQPRGPGRYRVKAVVRDSIGNTVDSDWSEPYTITPAISRGSPIAVLPFENLSGSSVSLDSLRATMREAMAASRLELLDADVLEDFMARHRVRYVGGISSTLGRALEEETGAAAVLVSSVEQYVDRDPPRIAIHSRLVSTGQSAAILWMDGAALAGHEAPGFLNLKRVSSIETLSERAVARIVGSLSELVAAEEKQVTVQHGVRTPRTPQTRRRFRPEGVYRSADSIVPGHGLMRVAVLPFENRSTRSDAGRLMTLHFVRRLAGRPDLEVVEPGNVRQALLQARLVMNHGPSLPQTDLLRSQLDVDVVITGTVTDYDDPRSEWGKPLVSFSVQGIESERRRVGWSSISHADGKDGVFFFERGTVHTAHKLAVKMVREVLARTMQPNQDANAAGAEPFVAPSFPR